ncbi:MAG TPA: hypothetical protein PLJ00_15010 [Chitinophagales bacterium]|nr:hypothetical protein [Chitinophagales bacterium]
MAKTKTKFEKGKADGQWRWQTKKGKNVISASTEGYENKTDCVDNFVNSTIANYIHIFAVAGVEVTQPIKPEIINLFKASLIKKKHAKN